MLTSNRNLGPPLSCHGFSTRGAALFAKRLCGKIFAVIKNSFFDLASGNLHDMDGVADDIGGALFAFETLADRSG